MTTMFNGESKKLLLKQLVLEGAQACTENFGGSVEKWRVKVRHEVGKIATYKTELQLRNAVNGAVGRVCSMKNSGSEKLEYGDYKQERCDWLFSPSFIHVSKEEEQLLDPEFAYALPRMPAPEQETVEEVIERMDRQIDAWQRASKT